ncbi:helix-turn-helix domain-containing protein [Alkalilacustris brevis]|uniref:helix-turn-helix domain-containing protein n=1 Tax=Alkalilacustris brevis TaxID=2026338 RepID=UPI0013904D1B|nr:helix-turn-helix domain-containing protein [Alkalilacustris brevis]
MDQWFNSTRKNKTLSSKWGQDCLKNEDGSREPVSKMKTARLQNEDGFAGYEPQSVSKMKTSLSTIPYALGEAAGSGDGAGSPPRLQAHRFDAMMRSVGGRQQVIWGAASIARALHVSTDTVYRWAKRPEMPIHKVGGRYFTTKADLLAILQGRGHP